MLRKNKTLRQEPLYYLCFADYKQSCLSLALSLSTRGSKKSVSDKYCATENGGWTGYTPVKVKKNSVYPKWDISWVCGMKLLDVQILVEQQYYSELAMKMKWIGKRARKMQDKADKLEQKLKAREIDGLRQMQYYPVMFGIKYTIGVLNDDSGTNYKFDGIYRKYTWESLEDAQAAADALNAYEGEHFLAEHDDEYGYIYLNENCEAVNICCGGVYDLEPNELELYELFGRVREYHEQVKGA